MIFERLFLGNKKFSFNQHHRQRVSFLVKKSYFFKATIFFLCLCGLIKTLKEAQEFLKDMKTPGTFVYARFCNHRQCCLLLKYI